jgi:condensin complex subunit 1
MMAKGMIEPSVIDNLWNVYGTTKFDIPREQRQGAIIVLAMLAKESKETVADKVSLMLKIGFGNDENVRTAR